MRYIEEEGKAVSVTCSHKEWLQKLREQQQAQPGWPLVARTRAGDVVVSTIFLVTGSPACGDCRYETVVIGGNSRYTRQHATRDQAMHYHRQLVDTFTSGEYFSVFGRATGVWSHHASLSEAQHEAQHMENATGEQAFISHGNVIWDWIESRWKHPVYDEVLDFTFYE